MPTVEVKNLKNEKVGDLELKDEVFGVPLNEALIYDAIKSYLANQISSLDELAQARYPQEQTTQLVNCPIVPDGSIARTVEMPAPIVTSVMFGGDDLDVLYVTSIGVKILGMEPGPEGGALFTIKGLGVKGKPEPRFAG